MSKFKKPKFENFKHLNPAQAIFEFHKTMNAWAKAQHWVRCVVVVNYKDGRTPDIMKFEPATKIHTYSLIDEEGCLIDFGVEVPLANQVLFKYHHHGLGITLFCSPTKLLEYQFEFYKTLGVPISDISVSCEPIEH